MALDPNRRYRCPGLGAFRRCGRWHTGWHRYPDTGDVYRSARCAKCSLPGALAKRDEQEAARAAQEAMWTETRARAGEGDQTALRTLRQDAEYRARVGLPQRGSDDEKRQEAERMKLDREQEQELVRAGLIRPRGIKGRGRAR